MFPAGFVWGAAAAFYQIEGAAAEDGKGSSVWDMFCRKPSAIANGDSGAEACDHYHRFQTDVDLMRDLGLQAYRLSIAWPRVLPDGTGAINQRGLDFYDRLVDALLEARVTPYVTLFHWDYPYALYCRGGWLNPDSSAWFAEYTERIVARLGDRVRHWITLNEPQCFVGLGHFEGRHAPGDQLDLPEVLRVAHHSLLAHGRAVQAIRATATATPLIGWAPVGVVSLPASDREEDVAAARQAMFAITKRDLWNNTWFSDPVCRGTYPDDGLALYGAAVPAIGPDDMQIIQQPLDFYGVNIYHGQVVRADATGQPEVVAHPVGHARTAFDWPVVPAALRWGPRFLQERYTLPIYITENGMANLDWIGRDGAVHDPQRIDFTAHYLLALRQAIADGVDVRGYFHWSIMDNFEWAEGYKQRFGLIYVDYASQRRVLKDSARWYQAFIASNGASLATGASSLGADAGISQPSM
jgi:beta-glucosidase